MRKKQTITSLLGITQDDMALILKVERSRLAKYEAGSRNLPLDSKLLIAEMIQCVSGTLSKEKKIPHPALQLIQKQETVQKLLKENEYQQAATARKISGLEERYTAKIRALQLLEFLANRADSKETIEPDTLNFIKNKTLKSLNSKGLDLLFKLKLKMELLQLEKLLLDAEVRKWKGRPENTDTKE